MSSYRNPSGLGRFENSAHACLPTMPLRLETRPTRRSDPLFLSAARSTSTILAMPSRLELLYGPPAKGIAPVTVHGHVSATSRSRAKDWIAAGKQLYSSAASTSRAETPASASAQIGRASCRERVSSWGGAGAVEAK